MLNKIGLSVVLSFTVLSARGDDLVGLSYSINSGPRSLMKVNAANGGMAAAVRTALTPSGIGNDAVDRGIGSGDGGIWVLGYAGNLGPRPLYKINPVDGAILEKVVTVLRPEGLGEDFAPRTLAYGDGYIWGLGEMLKRPTRPLYKLDPKTGKILQTITTGFKPAGIGTDIASIGLAYGDGSLWAFGYAVNNGTRPLYKINPADGSIAQTLTTRFRPATPQADVAALGLAYGDGHLWALGYSVNNGARPLYKINPANGQTVQTVTTSLKGSAFGTDLAELGFAYVEN